jgi:phosphoenolpyruvate synthase/pyruvate phosphate dikinase
MALWTTFDTSLSLDELGGKGFHLSQMHGMGLPVPKGIIIPTSVCRRWMVESDAVEAEISAEIPAMLEYLHEQFFQPLSIRSGAKFSMPGMMDTILNFGMDQEESHWKEKNEIFYTNSLRRFYVMYGNVVDGEPREELEQRSMEELELEYKFDPKIILLDCIRAVFRSWSNERAKTYRKLNNIPEDLGTAVVIQRMVFGNLDTDSYTGVLFSRDPSTGVNEYTGEFLHMAQGEDVVAGIRAGRPISELPEVYATELFKWADYLEQHYHDAQDIEFTVESGMLYILQTRNAKRTARAAVRIAVDMVEDNELSFEQLPSTLSLKTILAAATPAIDPSFDVEPYGYGIGASTGVVSGIAVSSSEEAIASKVPCILISKETSPDDLPGIAAAVGVLTQTGGATSHAAVVARSLNKVCVVGCDGLTFSERIGWRLYGTALAGKMITLDGASGRIWVDTEVPLVSSDADITRLVELVRRHQKGWSVTAQLDEVARVGTIFLAREHTPAVVVEVAQRMLRGVIDLRRVVAYDKYDSFLRGAFGRSTSPQEFVRLGTIVNGLKKLSVKRREIYVVLSKEDGSFKEALQNRGFRVVSVENEVAKIVSSDAVQAIDDPSLLPLYRKLSTVKKASASRLIPLTYSHNKVVGVSPLSNIALLQATFT